MKVFGPIHCLLEKMVGILQPQNIMPTMRQLAASCCGAAVLQDELEHLTKYTQTSDLSPVGCGSSAEGVSTMVQ